MANLAKPDLVRPEAEASSVETGTQDIELLEYASLPGRKTELRQLLKLLAMAKTGQPKAVLVLGDTGIGKTALLETFTEVVRRGFYSRVVDVSGYALAKPQDFYVAVLDALETEANAILDDALAAANDVTRELDLNWERQDLLRAVSLAKLQESIAGTSGVTPGSAQHEKLVKALRSSVPTSKKLKLPINDQIEKLVNLIINPWVSIAAAVLNPMDTGLKEALLLAQKIKTGKNHDTVNLPLMSGMPESKQQSETVIDVSPAKNGAGSQLAIRSEQNGHEGEQDSETVLLASTEKLLRHLATVFRFINSTLENVDTALLITLDQWERVLKLPEADREELKNTLVEFLKLTTDGVNQHVMVAVTARSEGESYTLGGTLYNLFRTKLLLPGLTEGESLRTMRHRLKQEGIELDEGVHRQIYKLTRGNPFWQDKLMAYVLERAEANKTDRLDTVFYDKLGIETRDDIFELSFTRLKLAFLDKDDALFKVVATILKQYDGKPFKAAQAIREISVSQGFADNFVFEVLKRMAQHDFLVPMHGTARQDLRYKFQSQHAAQFLKEKTRRVETDISTDEKLKYLKKVIPLSVKSGELDREKTREVIALSHTIGNDDMVQFLEEVFIENLDDERAVVRVTALNNLALIDSEKSREAVFGCIADENEMVREYATRNLSAMAQKAVDPLFHRKIVETLIDCVDDDYEIVREQVYETLARYRWNNDLGHIFVKGMSDVSDSVRLTCIKNLADMSPDSPDGNPFVKNALMDATDDASPDVRKYACLGIQHYPGDETIRLLVHRLREDSDPAIRALAADSLSRMEEDAALAALVDALYKEESEDVKLAVVRALGKRKSWKNEEILATLIEQSIETLDSRAATPPALLWAAVRSLGNVGGTERSKATLSDLKVATTNEIIVNAATFALRKIDERISDLRHLERQLEEATPTTVAVSSEYVEDIPMVEDEPIIINTSAEPSDDSDLG